MPPSTHISVVHRAPPPCNVLVKAAKHELMVLSLALSLYIYSPYLCFMNVLSRSVHLSLAYYLCCNSCLAFFSPSRLVPASLVCHHCFLKVFLLSLVALNLEAPTLYFVSAVLYQCEFCGELASLAFAAIGKWRLEINGMDQDLGEWEAEETEVT